MASMYLGTGSKPFRFYTDRRRKFLPVAKNFLRIVSYMQRQVQRTGNHVAFPMQPTGTGGSKTGLLKAVKVSEPDIII
jgi:hypothetical protein